MSIGKKWVVRAASAALAMLAGVMGFGIAPGVGSQAAPPVRVYGSVTIDGSMAPPGTLIEAVVNGASCGSDRLIGSTYVIDVEAAIKNPWCASSGSTVGFTIGGIPARETTVYYSGVFVKLDLSRAPVPLLDPDAERPRTEIVGRSGFAAFKIHPDADEKEVVIFSDFRKGDALAALYPATLSGAATLYIVAASGQAIMPSPGSFDRCTNVVGYSNMLVCTVMPGTGITFESQGP